MSDLLERGLAAHRAGRFEEAQAAYRQALAASDEDGEGLFLYGTLLLQLGRLPEAIDLLRRAAEKRPQDYRPWLNLAEALRLSGRVEEARTAAQQAAGLAPTLPGVSLLLGNLDRAQGFFLDALRHYRRAVEREPGSEAAWVNAVSLLLELGKSQEARDEARAGIALCPSPALKKLLGRAHHALGDKSGAIDAFIQAGDAESLVMAALIRHDEGRSAEAHDFFRRALAVDPHDALTRYNRARVYRSERKLEEAVADLRVCSEHHPDFRPALGFAAELFPLVGDFAGQTAIKERILSLGVTAGEVNVAPFEMLCLLDDPALQLASAQQTARELPQPRKLPPVAGDKPRLTIGYLSSDFISHALSRVMVGVFEKHDRQAFRVIAYATRPDDGSPIAHRIRAAADLVCDVDGWLLPDIAAQMARDEVDILVDLNGHTMNSSLGVLGYRPAPVQATYMGYPGTTGYGAVDYLIADGFVIPPGAEEHYSEAVVRLPHCYWAPDDRPGEAAPVTRGECGLPEEGMVFACFNRANKFSAEVIDDWFAILSDVPDAVFWLLAEHPALQTALRERARAMGLDPARLIFASPADYPGYLGRLAVVDLFLDTFPYNAHTQAFDALRQGALILTRCGQSFASRVAGSMLTALGLPELIAHDREDYRRRAVSLGHDTAQRARLRQRLREAGANTPVFDAALFTQHLEDAYRIMWQRAREGLAPAAINVPPRDLR